MTENRSYTFGNEQINLCDYVSQNTVFDLKKYDPYFDKIRAFFVPSLEYRVQSLLKEFVYSRNSRWTKQFPCFKKFIDALIMWKDSLNRIAEYDINTMEEIVKNIVKHMIKDDLLTCFLDSVILHHRLKKVCQELDTLGIEDDMLRNLNVWSFVNEDFNTTISMDCNMNVNTASCNTKKSIKYKKTVKPLAKNVYNKSTEYIRPTMSEYREHQFLDLNQNLLQQKKDNFNHYSTCVATGSTEQNDYNTNKINKSFNEKSCNTESKKIRSDLKLKIIIHKVHLEDYEYSTFSNANVTRLSLPCKPSNLVRRIFEADPSLTESCLIIMKRKFKSSIYNVCSCLNSVLEKLNIKLTKALCLNCEIYPAYIIFKLKAFNIKKHLFVSRVPICQNVHRCTRFQKNFSILFSNSNLNIEINESKCFEQCKNDNMNFNEAHVDEEAEKLETSQSNRTVKNVAIDMSQSETGNDSEKKLTENVSRYIQNLVNFSRNDSCEDIVEEISNKTSCVDNSAEKNKEYRKVLNSIGIDCDLKKDCDRKKILESSNSVTKNDRTTQLINNANCTCSSYENFIEINNEIKDIFSNTDLDSFSQTTSTDEHDYLSNKKSNLENEVCNTNKCSVISFVQNSEYDKQLVELNYNHLNNNTTDKHFDMQKYDSSLNSTKVEIGCNSYSCQCDDFIVTDNISKKNIICAFKTSSSNFNTTRSTDYSKTMQISSKSNNLLTISIQMPRSKILSKEINVDACYPRTVWLTSEDDKNISVMETSDEIKNRSTYTLAISKKENQIFSNINKEILDVKDGTQNFITSPERFSMSKGKCRSNEASRSSDISTGEYLRSKNHSTCTTSNASLCCRSFAKASEFTMSDKRDQFQKTMFHGCERSGNGIHSITSTTIKHGTTSHRYLNDFPTEIREHTVLAITKFRNSVDKSIVRIKRLLRKILFNNKTNNNNNKAKTLWKNEKSPKDAGKKVTSDKYGHSITSRLTCDCRRNYTTSSRESSNMIFSIRKTKGKRRCEENTKFCDHRLKNDNKTLLNFHSIKPSSWSYDLPTSTTEDIKKQKLNRNNQMRYDRKKKLRNVINNRNSHRCNLKNSETSITISSQSTKVSLGTKDDSKYFGYYTCKRQEETCDNKRMCKQVHNQDRRENKEIRYKYRQTKNKYRDLPIKYSNINSNESLKISSQSWRRNAKNVQNKQFYGIQELNNVKRCSRSKKDRQIFEKDVSDHSDDSLRSNYNLRKRHVFVTLTNICNDYINDLDLDFKLRLLRYVELCKSIKRSLMRTLQSDKMYEVNTISISDSDL